MKAREMRTQPVVTVRREASVAEAARAMVEHRTGCVLVVDTHGKLRGIVTQTDFAGDQHGVPYSMEALLQQFSHSMPQEALERLRGDARSTIVEKIMVTEVITATETTPLGRNRPIDASLRDQSHPGGTRWGSGWHCRAT
jgi:CBS-domain-containing membrane protein